MLEEPKDSKQKKKEEERKRCITGGQVGGVLFDVPATAQAPGARREIAGDKCAAVWRSPASARPPQK